VLAVAVLIARHAELVAIAAAEDSSMRKHVNATDWSAIGPDFKANFAKHLPPVPTRVLAVPDSELSTTSGQFTRRTIEHTMWRCVCRCVLAPS